ncbi:PAS domain S-box protein [Candidatus Venteria ishoeyi]|uniref:histidine kinase n=1 Tax=Candidatus Venteria ishoeyi TaxID=1899563 RepID=A0A1H6F312_9GAMM|nr:PAS domain S-box protein [Candidatus Venteria ishoeyi]MDM8545663.1 PAS domain S-box protein [Candidatus Venteria ishoeyi]SEH04547.1 Aerobic respiration control sensor protein ArcB [Candidatus Venteria ishoeyi]
MKHIFRSLWSFSTCLWSSLTCYNKVLQQNQCLNAKLKCLQGLFGSSNAAVTVIKNHKFLEVNDYLAEILGYVPADLIGQYTRLIYLDDKQYKAFDEQVYSALANTDKFIGEYVFRHQAGHPVWTYISVSKVDEDRDGVTIALLAIDISERKQMEAALRREHDLKQRYLDTVQVLMIALDNDGNITMLNRAGHELLGYANAELIGCNWFATCLPQPEGWETIYPLFKQAMAGSMEGIEYVENAVLCQDGSLRIIAWHNAYLCDDKGVMTGLLCSGSDITAHKQTERALQESRTRYQRLVEDIGSNFMLFSYRCDGIFEYVSNSVLNVFGKYPHEVIGQAWMTFTNWQPDSLAHALKITASLRCGELNETEIEMAFTHPDGSLRTINVTVHAVRNEQGENTHNEGIVEDISERKLAEQTVRNNEERYYSLISTMAEGVIMQNKAGEIITCNTAAERILGLTQAQIMGGALLDPSWRVIHEDGTDFPKDTHPLQQVLRTGQAQRNIILGIYHADAELYWILVNAEPMFQPGETLPYAGMATFIDITENRSKRLEIDQQRQTLQAVLKYIPMAVAVFAPNREVLLTNQLASELLGQIFAVNVTLNDHNHTYGTFIEGSDNLYPPEKMPLIRGLAGEITTVDDMEIRRSDHPRILLQMTGAPVRNDEGDITSCVVIFQDITMRKQAAYQQALNEIRLDASLALSRQASAMNEEDIFRAGLEDAEMLTNSAIAYLHFIEPDQESIHLGYWSKATLAQCKVVTDTHYSVSKAGIWADSVREQRSFIHNDYQHLKNRKGYPEGHNHLIRHMSVPVIENGKVLIIVGVGNKARPYDDIDLRQLELIARDLWAIVSRRHTEVALEQARRAAEAANRAKSAFLANMSHELRTPLNAVLGYAQILATADDLTADYQRMAQTINNSGEYLLTLLNDVLDLSKIEAGRYDVNPAPCHLHQFFNDITRLFQARAIQKNLEFRERIWVDQPKILDIDDKRVRQILLNLLSNAVKFTEQGHISLCCNYVDGFLYFTVRDSGIGIAPAKLNYIFKPFSQEGEDRYKAQGTGLGLAISQKLTEVMGGVLEVDSCLGQGSTFFLKIPAKVRSSRQENSRQQQRLCPDAAVAGYCHNGGHAVFSLLIVDDIQENQEILAALLKPLAFTLHFATCGEQCLEMLRVQQPDLIFMDMKMPGISGLETTRQIRKKGLLMPIIAVSASVFSNDAQEFLSAGCNDFIAKPVQKSNLLACLQTYLGLEWCYTSTQTTSTYTLKSGLSPEQREQLLAIARTGEVSKLFESLQALQQQQDVAAEATILLDLAKNFRMKELKEMLK